MVPNWSAAVVGLHDFFTRWFAGEIARDPSEFWAIEGALAEDFTAVSPYGRELDRAATLAMINDAYGSGTGGPRISILRCRVLAEFGPYAMVRYLEVQDFDDGRHTERVSTAVLEDVPTAPDGVRWHSVHETWLPEAP